MSIFDRILEAAQSKLVLGNPGLLEERLKGAKATLEAATANLPPAPDAESHHATLTALLEGLGDLDAAVLRELTKLRGDVAFMPQGTLANDGKMIDDVRSYA